MAVLCGTCAWSDHEHFYPRGLRSSDRLSFYARFFPLVEVDTTYYHIPGAKTVAQWVEATPDSFVFDVKAYQTLTLHDRGQAGTDGREVDHRAFRSALEPLIQAGKLGTVLFQFPPWFVRSENHQHYVEEICARYADVVVAVEFRHRSWWVAQAEAQTTSWLAEMSAVNVVCDEPQTGMGTIPFVPAVTQRKAVVFRLHGRNAQMWYEKGLVSSAQRFDYLYSQEELSAFLPTVRDWTSQAHDVHILMNNNQGDYAVRNALDWMSLLGIEPGGDVSLLPGRRQPFL